MSDRSASVPEPEKRISRLAEALGYLSVQGYFTRDQISGIPSYRHAIHQACQHMGVEACFGFFSHGADGHPRFTPIIYLACAESAKEANFIHHKVWSQGIVPFLLLARPDGVELRNGFSFTGKVKATAEWSNLTSASLPRTLQGISALSLRSSLAWKDFAPKPSERVDNRLLRSIQLLSSSLQRKFPSLNERADLINAMVGRFMYLFVLIDRGVIDQAWMDSLVDDQGGCCPNINLECNDPSIAWPADEVWRLFDCIDAVLNGAIFPVCTRERDLISTEVMHYIRRVIRNGDRIYSDGHQYSFVNVSYDVLRTETISSIYELFLSLESSEKKEDDGAFYTPPYLVDYILDELDAIRPIDEHSRVLDPAAGSGAFLVGAYRRLLERCAPPQGWGLDKVGELRRLLVNCIFAIEAHPQAANVARFSLYLTLLDYIPGAPLSSIKKSLGGTKLFPELDNNISCRDFFSEIGLESKNSYTHVVGNPPWTTMESGGKKVGGNGDRDCDEPAETLALAYRRGLNAREYPVDHNRLSELFVWKVIREKVAPGGAIALLISTKSFVSPGASRFPKALSERVKLVGLTNLWHFRYRLFRSARSPATAFFALAQQPNPFDPVWVYSPLLTSQPIAENGWPWAIVMDRENVDLFKQRDICTTPDTWFQALMLPALDRRNARVLWDRLTCSGQSLGDFFDKTGLFVGRGGTPEQTGLPKNKLLGTNPKKGNFYREALHLDAGIKRADYDISQYIPDLKGNFRYLFGGHALLITRNLSNFDFVPRPVGFGSSLNAVVFKDDRPEGEKENILRGLAAYLSSDVCSYLFSIFGRMWMLDGRRFERSDLLKLPIPFTEEDLGLISTAHKWSQDNLMEHFTRFFRLDSEFLLSVKEYVSFRSGYQDAQVPKNALFPPNDDQKDNYLMVLEDCLRASLGKRAFVKVASKDIDDRYSAFLIRIGLAEEDNQEDIVFSFSNNDFKYTDTAAIEFDHQRSVATLIKPHSRSAWTIERAYTDGLRIIQRIMRG